MYVHGHVVVNSPQKIVDCRRNCHKRIWKMVLDHSPCKQALEELEVV